MDIIDYCRNCGNPYYEKRESKDCGRCDRLLEEGNLDEYKRIKKEYIGNLLSGAVGSDAFVE